MEFPLRKLGEIILADTIGGKPIKFRAKYRKKETGRCRRSYAGVGG